MKGLVFITLITQVLITKAFPIQPLYPFVQNTENGLISCKSIPYAPFDADPSLGQTWIYSGKKLLYVVDRYFHNPFFTAGHGMYLVEFNFELYYRPASIIVESNGSTKTEKPTYQGKAINIYRKGQFFKTIQLSDLQIDTSRLHFKRGNSFVWAYQAEDRNNEMQVNMEKNPFYYEDGFFYVVTADNQLIKFNLSTGAIISKEPAYTALKKKKNWNNGLAIRKYKPVRYPEEFSLPALKNGKSLPQAMAKFLNKTLDDKNTNKSKYQIYIQYLLIDKNGKCEDVFVSAGERPNLNAALIWKPDITLKLQIENWLKEQTFDTAIFPKGFQKYNFTDFVYFK